MGAKKAASAGESIVWKGAGELKALLVPMGALGRDPANTRVHGQRSLEAVSVSLRRFGQLKPIVVAGGVIVAGNGTHEAAERLGWSHVAAVDAGGLSAEELKAFAVADNRTAELSEWNFEALSITLKALPEDLQIDVGFAAHELEPLLRSDWAPKAGADGLPQSDGKAGLHHIALTTEQWDVVQRALAKLEASTGVKPASVPEGVVGVLKKFLLA